MRANRGTCSNRWGPHAHNAGTAGVYAISPGAVSRYPPTGDHCETRTGNLLDAFISFSDRFERMLLTPGRRRSVLSTKAL